MRQYNTWDNAAWQLICDNWLDSGFCICTANMIFPLYYNYQFIFAGRLLMKTRQWFLYLQHFWSSINMSNFHHILSLYQFKVVEHSNMMVVVTGWMYFLVNASKITFRGFCCQIFDSNSHWVVSSRLCRERNLVKWPFSRLLLSDYGIDKRFTDIIVPSVWAYLLTN